MILEENSFLTAIKTLPPQGVSTKLKNIVANKAKFIIVNVKLSNCQMLCQYCQSQASVKITISGSEFIEFNKLNSQKFSVSHAFHIFLCNTNYF